jgi:hypothetical protein
VQPCFYRQAKSATNAEARRAHDVKGLARTRLWSKTRIRNVPAVWPAAAVSGFERATTSTAADLALWSSHGNEPRSHSCQAVDDHKQQESGTENMNVGFVHTAVDTEQTWDRERSYTKI